MKIPTHIPVYSLTYLTMAAGLIVILITHYSETDIHQAIEPAMNAIGKLRFNLLLLLYSVFALFVFAILKIKTKTIMIRKQRLPDTQQPWFRYAVIGIFLALLLFAFVLSEIWHFNPMAHVDRIADKIEFPRIHSWLILLSSVLTAALADAARINREEKLRQAERRYTLAITMRTVQDIVGNFMNSIQLYRMRAEKSGALDRASLAELDKLIYTTSDRINTLASLKFVAEKEVARDLYVLDIDEEDSPGKGAGH